MNITWILVNYVLLLVSFFCFYAVTRQVSRILRNTAFFIYLASGGLFTFFVINEIINPSEDANIGMGGSILLVEFVSIVGIIVAVITLLVRMIKIR
ncbi:hypothetical protein [Pradoshia sp.]